MRVNMALLLLIATSCSSAAHVRIVAYRDPELEFAAREARRYIRLTTGAHAALVKVDDLAVLPSHDEAVVISTKDGLPADLAADLPALATSGHHSMRASPTTVLAVGADRTGVLYAAYELAQQLGVVFALHGDILPDATKALPLARCASAPLSTCVRMRSIDLSPEFAHRGLQPFHDFTSGPDWWSASMYKHVLANIAKLKMNFIGLHTYPFGPNATPGGYTNIATGKNEPTVWVGPPEGLTADGSVKPAYAYKTSYANTGREEWNMSAVATTNFSCGAAQLFESDCYGSPVQRGACPWPAAGTAAAGVFEATSTLLSDAFAFADRVDVDTCVGTESALSKPPVPAGAATPTTAEYYAGIFTRLLKKIPSLKWYWIWTPESWEWSQVDAASPLFTAAVQDLANASESRDAVNPGLKLMTNGWVVGPLPDRTIFDKTISSKFEAIASIDGHFGQHPVDPAYKDITHHAKWVIPWMEDDPSMTAPQLWLNRTLEHMTDAKSYGIVGLLGIMWRTHAVSPTVSAMGQRSWDANLTSSQFWTAWSAASFGARAGPALATIFESIDSFNMPTPAHWINGPGGFAPDAKECALVSSQYAFVDAFSAARTDVSGAVDMARFEYWLNSFKYMRSIAVFECAWATKDAALAAARSGPEGDARRAQALVRATDAMVATATAMLTYLQQTITSPGELGTYTNVERHSLINAFGDAEERAERRALLVAAGLGAERAAAPALLPTTYQGAAPRLIVPVARATVVKGEILSVRALVLAKAASKCAVPALLSRASGSSGAFASLAMTRVAPGRAVYTAALPAATDDFEWYVAVQCAASAGGTLVFPAGSPAAAQSVTLM